MSSGIMPFGALPQFAGLSPDDLARLARSQQPASPSPVDGLLFDRAGMGGQGGFSGTSGTIVPPAVAARPEPEADAPAPRAMPAPPVRPLTFGSLPAPAPAAPATTGTVPASSASAAPTSPPSASEPSFLDRIGSNLRDVATDRDLLISLGIGLMSTPGWGQGAAVGLKGYQDSIPKRAAADLARAEYGLKVQQAQREAGALTGNAAILKKAYPDLSEVEAQAQASNGTAVTEALKILRDPNHGRDNDPAIIRAKAQAQAEGSAAGKPDDTYSPLSEADRIARGLPVGAYQVDSKNKVSPVNPTGTTINMGGEKAYDAEVGKTYAKQFSDLMTSDRNAGAKLNSLALMEQQMGQPGFYSGFGGEQVKRVNQLLGALGIKDPKAASGAEAVAALSNQVVLDQLGGSLGAGVSNPDRNFIVEIGPGLGKTPEGNKQLIGIYRAMAQRQQQVGQMARDYAKANGGRIDAGFDEQVSRFANENPLFPAASRAAQAQSDGVSGPTAAPGVAAPRTQADFDALPKGAMYVDPADGRRYRKN
ncbi:MAG: hypothetical protein K2X54_07775 [Methylobacterium organophilum]|nr:hypothetical protein [Methylobacterium organophilum]